MGHLQRLRRHRHQHPATHHRPRQHHSLHRPAPPDQPPGLPQHREDDKGTPLLHLGQLPRGLRLQLHRHHGRGRRLPRRETAPHLAWLVPLPPFPPPNHPLTQHRLPPQDLLRAELRHRRPEAREIRDRLAPVALVQGALADLRRAGPRVLDGRREREEGAAEQVRQGEAERVRGAGWDAGEVSGGGVRVGREGGGGEHGDGRDGCDG